MCTTNNVRFVVEKYTWNVVVAANCRTFTNFCDISVVSVLLFEHIVPTVEIKIKHVRKTKAIACTFL